MRANTGLGRRRVQSRPGTLTRGDGGSVATPALRLELRRSFSKKPILRSEKREKREEEGTKRTFDAGPAPDSANRDETPNQHIVGTRKRCFRPNLEAGFV